MTDIQLQHSTCTAQSTDITQHSTSLDDWHQHITLDGWHHTAQHITVWLTSAHHTHSTVDGWHHTAHHTTHTAQSMTEITKHSTPHHTQSTVDGWHHTPYHTHSTVDDVVIAYFEAAEHIPHAMYEFHLSSTPLILAKNTSPPWKTVGNKNRVKKSGQS